MDVKVFHSCVVGQGTRSFVLIDNLLVVQFCRQHGNTAWFSVSTCIKCLCVVPTCQILCVPEHIAGFKWCLCVKRDLTLSFCQTHFVLSFVIVWPDALRQEIRADTSGTQRVR